MGEAHVEQTRLHVSDTGDGPPLVLLHGFPIDSRIWDDVIPLLTGRRVIVPDLRGFGRSERSGPFSMGQLACDIVAMLNVMKIEKAAIAGLSMGGYVAQEILRVAPQCVAQLILIDSKAEADTVEAQNKRNAMAALARDAGAAAVADQMIPNMLRAAVPLPIRQRLRSIIESQRPDTIAHACVAMRDREDFVNLVTESNRPIDLIVGKQDAITPPGLMQALHSKLKFGRLQIIEEAGHMSPLEQPAAVAAALMRMTEEGISD